MDVLALLIKSPAINNQLVLLTHGRLKHSFATKNRFKDTKDRVTPIKLANIFRFTHHAFI